MTSPTNEKKINFLFVHVPKASNYYKIIDEYSFINFIPMGVFAICDLLNREGISSRITHLGLETLLDGDYSISKRVAREQVPIVGMSLHWHYQSYDVIDIAKKIREQSPKTKIILGGLTASRFAEEIMREFPQIYAVIQGDAESSVIPFAKAILNKQYDLTHVNNCVWRNTKGKIVKNGISYVADDKILSKLDFCNLKWLDHREAYRDYFKMPMFWMVNDSVKNNLKIRMKSKTLFPLAIGRGCPANCSFCGGGKEAQKKICGRENFVFRTPNSIVHTMEQAVSYGYQSFLTSFDPTPKDDTFYIQFLSEIRKRNLTCGLALEFWGLPSERIIKAFSQTVKLRNSYIALSPESGSEEIRCKNKEYCFFSNNELEDTMKHLLKYNVPTIIYLTAGIPGETSKHMAQTVKFANKLKRKYGRILNGIICMPVQIEPGSPLFENPKKWGVTSSRSSFMDFYLSHGECDSGPLDYLGYSTDTLSEGNNQCNQFRSIIQDFRCKNFCVLNLKLFGRIHINKLSQFFCALRYKRWKRKGFGKMPEFRRTFC
jgi:radical SAM superfamily enzyme YgiQ (UPF0313 family)